MTPVDLDALEAAAKAAYQGDWSERTKWPDGTGGIEEIITADPEDTRLCGEGYRTRVIVYMPNASDDEANAAYIVAAQPSAVLALIAELRAAREALTTAEEAGERRGLERAAEIARLSASVGAAMQQLDAALRTTFLPTEARDGEAD